MIESKRTLTDADADAIVNGMIKRMADLSDKDVDLIFDGLSKRVSGKFYTDLGRGVWGAAKAAGVAILLMLAAYGAKISVTDVEAVHK